MNFARLALSGQGNQLASNHKDGDYILESVREWSYYAHTFAMGISLYQLHSFGNKLKQLCKAAQALNVK